MKKYIHTLFWNNNQTWRQWVKKIIVSLHVTLCLDTGESSLLLVFEQVYPSPPNTWLFLYLLICQDTNEEHKLTLHAAYYPAQTAFRWPCALFMACPADTAETQTLQSTHLLSGPDSVAAADGTDVALEARWLNSIQAWGQRWWVTAAGVGGRKATQVTSSNRITAPLKAAGQALTEPTEERSDSTPQGLQITSLQL